MLRGLRAYHEAREKNMQGTNGLLFPMLLLPWNAESVRGFMQLSLR